MNDSARNSESSKFILLTRETPLNPMFSSTMRTRPKQFLFSVFFSLFTIIILLFLYIYSILGIYLEEVNALNRCGEKGLKFGDVQGYVTVRRESPFPVGSPHYKQYLLELSEAMGSRALYEIESQETKNDNNNNYITAAKSSSVSPLLGAHIQVPAFSNCNDNVVSMETVKFASNGNMCSYMTDDGHENLTLYGKHIMEEKIRDIHHHLRKSKDAARLDNNNEEDSVNISSPTSVVRNNKSVQLGNCGVETGMRWQCVEYARRYLYLKYGVVFESVEGAEDIFYLSSVHRVDVSDYYRTYKYVASVSDDYHPYGRSPLPLVVSFNAFPNEYKSPNAPQPHDLIIWKRQKDMPYGHVAVVLKIRPFLVDTASHSSSSNEELLDSDINGNSEGADGRHRRSEKDRKQGYNDADFAEVFIAEQNYNSMKWETITRKHDSDAVHTSSDKYITGGMGGHSPDIHGGTEADTVLYYSRKVFLRRERIGLEVKYTLEDPDGYSIMGWMRVGRKYE